MTDYIIDTNNVSIAYKLYANSKNRLKEALSPSRKKYHRDFYALKNVSFKVSRGEVLGIVGNNGAGKSTLLKIISGILQPSSGNVQVRGKVFALLELGSGFNPEFTGMENIYFFGMIHDIEKEVMDELVDEIVDFTNIGDFIHQPVKTYSTGMRARLAFAAATAVKPEVLIIDEVLAVGDAQFKRKSYARMEKLIEGGTTVLFVSHSHAKIVGICSRVLMLRNGELVLDGGARNVVKLYLKSLDSKKEISTDELRGELSLLEGDIKKCGPDNEVEHETLSKRPELLSQSLKNNKKHLKGMSASLVELRNADVSLEQIYVEDENGVTGILSHQRRYDLTVIFHFGEEVSNAVFSFVIRTKEGLCVSGIKHPDDKSFISKINAGSVVRVKWNFYANMIQGDYFVTVSVTSFENEEKNTMYSGSDALAFKIIHDEQRKNWGLVSLGQKLVEFDIDKIDKTGSGTA